MAQQLEDLGFPLGEWSRPSAAPAGRSERTKKSSSGIGIPCGPPVQLEGLQGALRLHDRDLRLVLGGCLRELEPARASSTGIWAGENDDSASRRQALASPDPDARQSFPWRAWRRRRGTGSGGSQQPTRRSAPRGAASSSPRHTSTIRLSSGRRRPARVAALGEWRRSLRSRARAGSPRARRRAASGRAASGPDRAPRARRPPPRADPGGRADPRAARGPLRGFCSRARTPGGLAELGLALLPASRCRRGSCRNGAAEGPIATMLRRLTSSSAARSHCLPRRRHGRARRPGTSRRTRSTT